MRPSPSAGSTPGTIGRAFIEPESRCEHRRGALLDHVGVGVGRDEGAVGSDEAGEKRALVPVFGDARDPAEQEGMVRDEQVGTSIDGFVDGGGHGVDREVHALHRGIRIAGDETGCVPRLRARERPESVDRREDLGEGDWHPPSLAPRRNRPEVVGPAGLEPTTSTV